MIVRGFVGMDLLGGTMAFAPIRFAPASASRPIVANNPEFRRVVGTAACVPSTTRRHDQDRRSRSRRSHPVRPFSPGHRLARQQHCGGGTKAAPHQQTHGGFGHVSDGGSFRRPQSQAGPPMTLGNMCANGVRSLDVCCWLCHHRAILSAAPWPDHK
jgi:hypothetical protein